jgi:hypothetical protein
MDLSEQIFENVFKFLSVQERILLFSISKVWKEIVGKIVMVHFTDAKRTVNEALLFASRNLKHLKRVHISKQVYTKYDDGTVVVNFFWSISKNMLMVSLHQCKAMEEAMAAYCCNFNPHTQHTYLEIFKID